MTRSGSGLRCLFAETVASTVTYLWFGGHKTSGETLKVNVGGVASTQIRLTWGSWSLAWTANSELTCTTSYVKGRAKVGLPSRIWSSVSELPSNT